MTNGLTNTPGNNLKKSIKDYEDYEILSQSSFLNELAEVNEANTEINSLPGLVIGQHGRIEYRKHGKPLSTNDMMTLDVINFLYNKKTGHPGRFIITTAEYMEIRNRSDRKSSRSALIHSIDSIYESELTFNEGKRINPKFNKNPLDVPIARLRILSTRAVVRGGVEITLNPDFKELLDHHALPMPANKKLLQMSAKNHLSWELGRRLFVNKITNFSNPSRANNMRVGTLIAHSSLPSKDKVHHHIHQRIIEPFLKALNFCEDEGVFHYSTLFEDNPWTDSESTTYEEFCNVVIHITDWGEREYPDALVANWKEKRNKKKKTKKKPKKK